jgi:hypothetical protein
MTRATEDSFDELHSLVADALKEQINAWKAGRLVTLQDGEYVKVFPPALMQAAIKFLDSNGVNTPARKGNRVDTLKDAMPEYNDDNVLPMRRA